MSPYYFLAFVALLASPVWSYSSGAPNTACNGLRPKHPNEDKTKQIEEQTIPAPYLLKAESKAKTSEPLKVILSATGAEDIQGFLVQAIADGKPVGTFSPGISDSLAQVLQCTPGKSDTLTHKKIKDSKVREVTFTWTPSADLKGKKVKLVATVAANYATFWIKKVQSDVTIV